MITDPYLVRDMKNLDESVDGISGLVARFPDVLSAIDLAAKLSKRFRHISVFQLRESGSFIVARWVDGKGELVG